MNSSCKSIYIPRMRNTHTEDTIKRVMCLYGIGNVVRIDFTQINKKPGFCEIADNNLMSAFIHFSEFVYGENSSSGIKFWEQIESGKPYGLTIPHMIPADRPYKCLPVRNEYWICLKNKKPIQETMMNIHQVVENGRYLENLVEEQRKTIERQQKDIETLNGKVDELINNLCIKNYNTDDFMTVNELGGGEDDVDSEDDVDGEDDDDNSCSTHSSMPSLVDCN